MLTSGLLVQGLQMLRTAYGVFRDDLESFISVTKMTVFLGPGTRYIKTKESVREEVKGLVLY